MAQRQWVPLRRACASKANAYNPPSGNLFSAMKIAVTVIHRPGLPVPSRGFRIFGNVLDPGGQRAKIPIDQMCLNGLCPNTV